MIELIKNNIKQDKLPFFAKEGYLRSMSDDYGWFVSDEFVLPFIIRKRYVFSFLTFTSETVYLNEKCNSEDEKIFLNEVLIHLSRTKYDFITQPPTNVLFNSYPDKSTYCNFGSYIIDLKQNEDLIFSNIHSKHKNVIRKAARDGVEIERGLHLKDVCFRIINGTLSRQGLSFMEMPLFEKLVNHTNENLEFIASKRNNIYEGAAIIPNDDKTAYYMYGGSTENHHLGSMNLLHWEAIKYFKNRGVESYNFVGARLHTEKDSKLHGIQEFKRRFGGVLKTGYLWKYNIHPLKKQLYDSLIFLKTGKKQKDIIDNEREK